MKIAHRKTLWIHTLFSFSVCALLGILIWLNDNLPTTLVAGMIILYVVGNAIIHIKRDDYKQDTLIEYVLLGTAIFIVLAGSLS